MTRSTYLCYFLLPALAALSGCSSKPPAGEAKKAATKLDRIQGKVQVLVDPSGSATSDSALNAGGPSVYLWVGPKRYRLFSRTVANVVHGNEYLVEGIDAQRVIDEIGDPAQGKNGYPLEASCSRVVRMAWTGLAFDEVDVKAAVLRNRAARYPARPIFLVTRIEPATASAEKKAEAQDAPTVSVAAQKQSASLVEGSPVQTAPLWEPAGASVKCKVIINPEGRIDELETGSQLCEAVPWAQFRYKPTLQGGRPAYVRTEVDVRFEARK